MKNSVLQLNIISAEKKLFSGTVSSVIIPGVAGRFGVLPGHAPLISALSRGEVIYVKDGGENALEVSGGIVEVSNNVVTICVA